MSFTFYDMCCRISLSKGIRNDLQSITPALKLNLPGLNTIPSYLHTISSSKKPTRDFILVVTLYLDSRFELWNLRPWYAIVGYLCEQGYSKENTAWNFVNIDSYFSFWKCWPDIIPQREDFDFFLSKPREDFDGTSSWDGPPKNFIQDAASRGRPKRKREKGPRPYTLLGTFPVPLLQSSRPFLLLKSPDQTCYIQPTKSLWKGAPWRRRWRRRRRSRRSSSYRTRGRMTRPPPPRKTKRIRRRPSAATATSRPASTPVG